MNREKILQKLKKCQSTSDKSSFNIVKTYYFMFTKKNIIARLCFSSFASKICKLNIFLLKFSNRSLAPNFGVQKSVEQEIKLVWPWDFLCIMKLSNVEFFDKHGFVFSYSLAKSPKMKNWSWCGFKLSYKEYLFKEWLQSGE